MKTKITFLLISTLLALNVKAAILLVNNYQTSGVQYSQITAAIAAANNDDTILVSGSPYAYGNVIITKPLTLLGTGANPQKQAPYTSSIGSVTISGSYSGIKVKGLIISDVFSLASGTTNLELEDCYFTTSHLQLSSSCSNNKVSNCIFLNTARNIDGFDPCGGYYGGCLNFLIQNCIFNGSVSGLNIPGTVIQNNIFIGSYDAFNGVNVINNGGCYSSSYIINATIQNNIFYRANPLNYTSGCAYNNNISYSSATTFSAMAGSGNIDNTDPQFTNFPVAGDYFSYAYNFHLLSASPGHNAGTDGKDIGFYGGAFPSSTYGEVPGVPVMRQMNLQNTNVIQGGNVNVKVRSTKARTN